MVKLFSILFLSCLTAFAQAPMPPQVTILHNTLVRTNPTVPVKGIVLHPDLTNLVYEVWTRTNLFTGEKWVYGWYPLTATDIVCSNQYPEQYFWVQVGWTTAKHP